MNTDEQNRIAWDKQVRTHKLLYPDEQIVRFLAKNFPDILKNSKLKALDVGCGSGRHVQLLLDYGFQSYGIDYAASAIEVAYAHLGHHSLLRSILHADLKDKSYPDNFFDLIVNWGSIFLRSVPGIEADLQTLLTILKPGGRLLLNFRTKENWFFAKGQTQDGKTYILDDTAGPYKTMCYTFLDLAEAAKLLERVGFTIENSERLDIWKSNVTEQHSWWVFWVQKPE